MNGPSRSEIGLTILRATIGFIFVTHGAAKLYGGVGATAAFLAQLGVPAAAPTAWALMVLEVFGGAALVAGFLVRPLAVLFCIHMITGILLVHGAEGWYVVGPGRNGAEFNVLLVAGLLTLLLAGPGAAAFDRRRADRRRGPEDVLHQEPEEA